MLGIRRTKLYNQPLTPAVVNELVDTKENTPTPPIKNKIIPWVILGLSILFVLVGGIMVIWRVITQPDLIVNAPKTTNSELTPTPTASEEIIAIGSQKNLFEEKPYRNEEARFEISVPLGWEVDDSGASHSILVLTNPQATIASGSALITFVNVAVGEQSNDTLDVYVNNTRTGLNKTFNSYKIEEDKRLVIRGVTYHLIGGSYLTKGHKMKNRNVLLVYNDRGYAISATTPEVAWPKTEMLLNSTIFSFKNF